MVEGDEVLTLRREECGAQELFVNTAQILEDRHWRKKTCNLPRLIRRDRGGGLGRDARTLERSVEAHRCEARQRVAGLRKFAWEREEGQSSFSEEEELVSASGQKVAMERARAGHLAGGRRTSFAHVWKDKEGKVSQKCLYTSWDPIVDTRNDALTSMALTGRFKELKHDSVSECASNIGQTNFLE